MVVNRIQSHELALAAFNRAIALLFETRGWVMNATNGVRHRTKSHEIA